MHLIRNGYFFVGMCKCTFQRHTGMWLSHHVQAVWSHCPHQKWKLKMCLLPKFLLLFQFHFQRLVLYNIDSGLAKSSWGSVFLISSTSFCYIIQKLSDNVIINPLPMYLKKNPETLDGFWCCNLKDKKEVVFWVNIF